MLVYVGTASLTSRLTRFLLKNHVRQLSQPVSAAQQLLRAEPLWCAKSFLFDSSANSNDASLSPQEFQELYRYAGLVCPDGDQMKESDKVHFDILMRMIQKLPDMGNIKATVNPVEDEVVYRYDGEGEPSRVRTVNRAKEKDKDKEEPGDEGKDSEMDDGTPVSEIKARLSEGRLPS